MDTIENLTKDLAETRRREAILLAAVHKINKISDPSQSVNWVAAEALAMLNTKEMSLMQANTYLSLCAKGIDPFAKAFEKETSCPDCGGSGSHLCFDHEMEFLGASAEKYPVGRPVPRT